MDEVERAYRLVVCGDARFRRAGEAMSLGVLEHGRETKPGVGGTSPAVPPPSQRRCCRGG